MAEDYVARMMAISAMSSGGGSGDAYTKAETDELLATKADKATTYTKTEIDNMIGGGGAFTPTEAQLTAMNSGITSIDVDQIETNKNNILYNTDNGVKNVFNPSLQSKTGDHYTVIRNSDNTYTFTYDGHSSDRFVTLGTFMASKTRDYLFSQGADGSAGTAILFINIDNNYYYAATTGNGTVVPMTADTEYSIICKLSANSQGSWTLKPMIRLQGGADYQPYAMSNAELTAAIQALQAQLANQ